MNRVGASVSAVPEWRFTAAMVTGSRSSTRAIGTPHWTISTTVATAASTLGKAQTEAATASGMPWRRTVSSVTMPSVPSEPTSSRVRS